MWVYPSGALFIQWFIGRVLVHEHIMSAWEELCKRDEGQVRPMDRCPSVPVRFRDHAQDLVGVLGMFCSSSLSCTKKGCIAQTHGET